MVDGSWARGEIHLAPCGHTGVFLTLVLSWRTNPPGKKGVVGGPEICNWTGLSKLLEPTTNSMQMSKAGGIHGTEFERYYLSKSFHLSTPYPSESPTTGFNPRNETTASSCVQPHQCSPRKERKGQWGRLSPWTHLPGFAFSVYNFLLYISLPQLLYHEDPF